jgi:hypothetical protein
MAISALGLATAGALLICVYTSVSTSNVADSSRCPAAVPRDSSKGMLELRLQGVPDTTDPQQDLRDKLKVTQKPTRNSNGSTRVPGSRRSQERRDEAHRGARARLPGGGDKEVAR